MFLSYRCFGFLEELCVKYGGGGRALFEQFQACFQQLPLVTVVNDVVMVVHGGLPRAPNVTLEDIEAINHRRPIPLLHDAADAEDTLFEDLVRVTCALRSLVPSVPCGGVPYSTPSMCHVCCSPSAEVRRCTSV